MPTHCRLSVDSSLMLDCYADVLLISLCPVTFQNAHPIFTFNWECVVSFLWNTEAACPIQTITETDHATAHWKVGFRGTCQYLRSHLALGLMVL